MQQGWPEFGKGHEIDYEFGPLTGREMEHWMEQGRVSWNASGRW